MECRKAHFASQNFRDTSYLWLIWLLMSPLTWLKCGLTSWITAQEMTIPNWFLPSTQAATTCGLPIRLTSTSKTLERLMGSKAIGMKMELIGISIWRAETPGTKESQEGQLTPWWLQVRRLDLMQFPSLKALWRSGRLLISWQSLWLWMGIAVQTPRLF